MKKLMLQSLLFIILTALIWSCDQNGEHKQDKPDLSAQWQKDLLKYIQEKGLDSTEAEYRIKSEIPEDLERRITPNVFTKNNSDTSVSIGNYKINMPDFIEFVKSLDKDGGIRMYPAYDQASNVLYYLFAKAKKQNAPAEVVPYFIVRGDFSKGTFPGTAKTSAEVRPAFIDYHDKVWINRLQQGITEEFKKSRFYSRVDLVSYLRRNGIKIYDTTANYDDYSIRIQGGYIDASTSEEIALYFPSDLPDDCSDEKTCEIGFTGLMRVLKAGNPLLTGYTLEIAKPCPPKCGSLTWP